MATEIHKSIRLIVEREDGVSIDKGKVDGNGWFDQDHKEFHFKVRPTREKTNSKNAKEFSGDFMTMRLQKSGAHRVTFMLHPQVVVDEVEDSMVEELRKLLNVLR